MTSEVLLMNRLAVAMAADSAVTIGQGQKIYQSAIKLFTLSKYHPIGVMIYNSADILGYPWETIIKSYRQGIGEREFDTVAVLVEDFRDFLKRNDHALFTPDLQKELAQTIAAEVARSAIKKASGVRWNSPSPHEFSPQALMGLALKVVGERRAEVGSNAILPCFKEDIESAIVGAYGEDLLGVIRREIRDFYYFPASTPDDDLTPIIDGIVHLTAASIARMPMLGSYTGIVVAGFGKTEFLPSMCHAVAGGVFCDQFKWVDREHKSIIANGLPIIRPFAQSQMASTFIDGIDPSLGQTVKVTSIQMVIELMNSVIDAIGDLNDEQKTHWKGELVATAVNSWENYSRQIDLYVANNHKRPLERIIAVLPKDELAEIAEAMVSLNALKLKMSNAQETVAGPIDVAVITKGDGFVWIKRKHYFKTELNPQFVANYFRSGLAGEK